MQQVDTDEKNLFMRFLEWREEHISEKTFILILAFTVGFFAAVAAFILHELINQIVTLLTGSFNQD
jgi:CIC family chloride channel protein